MQGCDELDYTIIGLLGGIWILAMHSFCLYTVGIIIVTIIYNVSNINNKDNSAAIKGSCNFSVTVYNSGTLLADCCKLNGMLCVLESCVHVIVTYSVVYHIFAGGDC